MLLSFEQLAQNHRSFFDREAAKINSALDAQMPSLDAANKALDQIRASHIASLNERAGSFAAPISPAGMANPAPQTPQASAPAPAPAPQPSAPPPTSSPSPERRENQWITQMKSDIASSLYGEDGQGRSSAPSRTTGSGSPSQPTAFGSAEISGSSGSRGSGFRFAEWANPVAATAVGGASANTDSENARRQLRGMYDGISQQMQSYL